MEKFFYVFVAALLVGEMSATNKVELRNLQNRYKVDLVMLQLKDYCHAFNDHSTDYLGKRRAVLEQEALHDALHVYLADSVKDEDEEFDVRCAELSQMSIANGPCTSAATVNLTEFWRKDDKGSKLRPYNGTAACDRELQGNEIWFRFTGDAGVQLSNKCRPENSCGADGGFWSDAEMPKQVGEIRFVTIYGSLRNNCDWYTWPTPNALTVQRCSRKPGDFVYKVKGTSQCSWAFCGMDVGATMW